MNQSKLERVVINNRMREPNGGPGQDGWRVAFGGRPLRTEGICRSGSGSQRATVKPVGQSAGSAQRRRRPQRQWIVLAALRRRTTGRPRSERRKSASPGNTGRQRARHFQTRVEDAGIATTSPAPAMTPGAVQLALTGVDRAGPEPSARSNASYAGWAGHHRSTAVLTVRSEGGHGTGVVGRVVMPPRSGGRPDLVLGHGPVLRASFVVSARASRVDAFDVLG